MNAPYSEVIKSMTDPILKHIDNLPDDLFFFLTEHCDGGIFMSHGMSDKNYENVKYLNRAGHILCPGPARKEKFVRMGVPAAKIHIVGWPRLDPVFQGKITKKPGTKKRVVWCPTHDAIQEISSYPAFRDYLPDLPGRYEVISSVHPARKRNRQTSLQAIVDADVVISDTSTMLYEALAIGRPVILLDFLVKDGVLNKLKGSFEEKIYVENICYHAESFERLPGLIEQALEEGIDSKTKEFMERVFPSELRGISGKAMADKLREIEKGAVRLRKYDGFDADYFERGVETGKSNYRDYSWERLGKYFLKTAVHIKENFNPETVLDAGCAKGFLVYALQKTGVDAYGIDASEYAVSKAPEEIKDKIKRGLVQKLPYGDNSFDVVVCFDVMEHIPEGEVAEVLKEFNRVANSTVILRIPTKLEPNDKDAYHETIRPREWWEQKLKSSGFIVAEQDELGSDGIWWFNVPEYLFVCKNARKRRQRRK